jgi:hypothetical protein
MNYTDVKNPQWVNAEHTLINCEVDFDDLNDQYVPFTANPSDTSNPSSKQIFDECVEGIWGSVSEYVEPPVPEYVAPPEPTKAELLAQLQELTAKIEALGA